MENNKVLEDREVSRKLKPDHRELGPVEAMTNSIPNHWKTLVQQSNIHVPIGS